MAAKLQSNSTNDEMELDITVEADDGVFLAFNGKDFETGEEVLDFVITNRADIREFFRMVDKARKDYERQTV